MAAAVTISCDSFFAERPRRRSRQTPTVGYAARGSLRYASGRRMGHRDKVVEHLETRAHPESGRTTRCSAHLDRSDVIILRERTSPDDHSTTWHVLLLPTDGNETKGAKTRAAELQALRTPCLYPLPGRALGPHTPCPCRSHACDIPLGAQPSPNLMAERCDIFPHRSFPTGTGNSCTMEGQTP